MKKLILTIGCFLLFFSLQAAHIIGGEITYRCIGNNNYEITMRIYRDCFGGGALFDSQDGSFTNATVTIYQGGSNTPFLTSQSTSSGAISLGPPIINNVPPDVSNPCLIVPDDVCVEQGVYVFNVNLPASPDSYHIVYQRCCRNNTINNIVDPGGTGATYYMELKPEAQQVNGQCTNSSPTFNNFPPIIICAGEPIDFDHSATDPDGDLLIYKFCSPKKGGGLQGTSGTPGSPSDPNGVAPDPDLPPSTFENVTFVASAYTPTNPMGGSPQVTINATSGLITGVPNTLGQFVVGVCVEEYRNGVLLSTVSRDFQFNVENCTPTVVADIQNDETIGPKEFVVNSCGNNVITFFNESYDQQYINTYAWEFDLGNGNFFTASSENATVTFPGLGTYEGNMVLNPGSPCTDSATIYVNIYPEIQADFTFAYDTCIAGPVSFTNQSFSGSGNITDNDWDFGDSNTSTEEHPDHLFADPGYHNVSLTVTDVNGCIDELTQTIEWFPVPPVLIIEPSIFNGCQPQYVFFNNLSTPIDETYDIQWDFGDGSTGTDISPSHVYENVGVYDVSVSITSPIGCSTSAFFPNWITVQPSPIADFTFTPNNPSNFEPEVDFIDQSTGAVQWLWDFNGYAESIAQNPTFEFPDTGFQEITLVVTHPSGCQDTTVKVLDIEPKVSYFLPNAFTPNNDATNDLFFGKGFYLGMTNFEMTIWNRWGEMVFETNDPNEGWNGKKFNTGKSSPNGVYIVVVKYTGPRGQDQLIKGFATLVR